MHYKHVLFETTIYEMQTNLDTAALFQRCQQHQIHQQSAHLSNEGGYQGHHFQDRELLDLIYHNIPALPGKELPHITIQAWVNINGPGHWNTLHNHLDECVLISGIFYVRCPDRSGNLWFYDPRFFSNTGTHYQYYDAKDTNAGGSIIITPKENLLLFFPPSLMHMVGPNMSQELRCSIAFNILVASRTQNQ